MSKFSEKFSEKFSKIESFRMKRFPEMEKDKGGIRVHYFGTLCARELGGPVGRDARSTGKFSCGILASVLSTFKASFETTIY